MHRAAVATALLLAPVLLAAQTARPSQPSSTTQNTVLIQQSSPAADGSITWTTQQASPEQVQRAAADLLANSCPVALHARQSSAAFRREVTSAGADPRGLAQHLHLTAASPQGRQIVAANVTVRGFADKARTLATSPAHDGADSAKTMDVKFPNQPGREAAADVTVPGLSGVTTIELNSVTYADGSTWKLTGGSVCRSPIDGFMLIGNR
jgi:hypothetical protein